MTRHRTRIIALIAGCAVAAGGAFAVTDVLSSPTPAAAVSTGNSPAQPAGTGSDAAGGSAQAAALSSVITTEAGNSPGATPAQRTASLRRARRALVRLRLLGGEHGQVTYETKNGSRTLAFERGTIESVAGNDLTVRAADGTTWMWQLTNTSVVREDGSRAASSALAAGQPVFTGGPVTGTTRDARLIVIRKLTHR